MSTQSHTITRSIVSGNGRSVLRVRCSCGGFTADAPRLSTAARRGQDRKAADHLAKHAQPEDAPCAHGSR